MSYKSIRTLLDRKTAKYIDEQNKELRLPLSKMARLFLTSPNHLKTQGILMHVPSFGSTMDVAQCVLELVGVLDPEQGFKYTARLEDMHDKRRSIMIKIDAKEHTIDIKRQHERVCPVSRLAPHTAEDIQAIFWQLSKPPAQHAHFMQKALEVLTQRGAFTNKHGGYDMEGICKLSYMYREDLNIYGDAYDPSNTIKRFGIKK